MRVLGYATGHMRMQFAPPHVEGANMKIVIRASLEIGGSLKNIRDMHCAVKIDFALQLSLL